MGVCFSSQYDEHEKQHSLQENPDEIKESSLQENTDKIEESSLQENTDEIKESSLQENTDGIEESSLQENTDETEESSTEYTLKSPSFQSVKDVRDLRENPGYSNLDSFTYDEMRMATKLFRKSEILGEGGFGVVYKGVIDDIVRSGYARTEVAVKRLNPQGFQGDLEWLTEINHLGHLQHPNIVKLIGYCCENHHRLLVYEYMASGSVEKHLFCGERTLTWSKRMKIALDAAKGLAFLHNTERLIFRDFKTSNILLDADFNAKLSDFGLAKAGPTGIQTHVSTRVKGTDGYAAPEYCMYAKLSARCDIYAFGVVLCEMLTGQRAVDPRRRSDKQHMVDRVKPALVRGKRSINRVIDSKIKDQCPYTTALKIADLAYMCLSVKPYRRPSMSEVVEILESVQTREPDEDVTS